MSLKQNKTKRKTCQQLAANKGGCKADDVLHGIAKDNLQTTTEEAKLHYEDKLVDQINI